MAIILLFWKLDVLLEVYLCFRGLELTVQGELMGAFLQQLQNEQTEAIIKQEPGLHFYSNDVAM